MKRVLILMAICGLVFVAWTYRKDMSSSVDLTEPGAVRFLMESVQSIRLQIANPRKAGELWYKDEMSYGTARTSAAAVEIWEYSTEKYLFVRIDDDPQTYFAVHPQKRGYRAKNDAWTEEWADFNPQATISTLRDTIIQLPVHTRIREYIFYLRANEEPTGWRILIVSRDRVETATSGQPILAGDLMDLPVAGGDYLSADALKALERYGGSLD